MASMYFSDLLFLFGNISLYSSCIGTLAFVTFLTQVTKWAVIHELTRVACCSLILDFRDVRTLETGRMAIFFLQYRRYRCNYMPHHTLCYNAQPTPVRLTMYK